MLYLIGGSPRSGKTLLSDKLLKERHAAPFHVDNMIAGIRALSPEFSRECGIDFDEEIPRREEATLKAARAMARPLLRDHEEVVIESDVLVPSHVQKIIDHVKHPTRICFLGLCTPDLETILRFEGKNDWLASEQETDRPEFVEYIKMVSNKLASECSELGYPFIDMSQNWNSGLEQAYASLVEI